MKDLYRKRPSLKTSYVALVCIVLLAVFVLIFRSNSGDHFVATRVVDFPVGTAVDRFVWLDDHTILDFFRNHDKFTWKSFNINEGSTVTLDALADVLHKNGVAPDINREIKILGGPGCLISPLRKWLFVRYGTNHNSLAINLDGFAIVRPESSAIGSVYWLSGDRGWVDFIPNGGRGYDAKITWLQSNATEVVHFPFTVGYPVGLRPQNEHLLMLYHSTNNVLVITEATFLSHPKILNKTSIALQPGVDIMGAVVAPDGSKIAWFEARPRTLPSIQLWDSFPYVHLEKDKIWSLVVYDVQTHKAESLGDMADFADATDLQWTVDNRSISFAINRRLYIVTISK